MHNTDSFSKHYSQSIRFKSDGFSLYIKDEHQILISSKNIIIHKALQTEGEFIDLLSNEKELSINYTKINFVYETDIYAIVPLQIFKTEQARDFLAFQDL